MKTKQKEFKEENPEEDIKEGEMATKSKKKAVKRKPVKKKAPSSSYTKGKQAIKRLRRRN